MNLHNIVYNLINYLYNNAIIIKIIILLNKFISKSIIIIKADNILATNTLDRIIYALLLKYKLWDRELISFVKKYTKSGMIVIDIGANIGSYSILASTIIGCHTLSFEPSVENYKILNSNVQLNNVQSTIKLYNYALGDKNESKTIGFKGAMTYITNNKRLNLQRTVIKKLDNIVTYANLLKVDVEGYEEFVLKGAKGVLSHPKTNAIIIELAGYNRYGSSDEKVHNLLIQHNFFPIKYFPYERIFNRLTTYRKNQFNTIYIRDEKFVENRLINSPKYKIGNQYI